MGGLPLSWLFCVVSLGLKVVLQAGAKMGVCEQATRLELTFYWQSSLTEQWCYCWRVSLDSTNKLRGPEELREATTSLFVHESKNMYPSLSVVPCAFLWGGVRVWSWHLLFFTWKVWKIK